MLGVHAVLCSYTFLGKGCAVEAKSLYTNYIQLYYWHIQRALVEELNKVMQYT
jgi:hypothetical protein